jgi:microcystin-dependent protein
MQGNAPMFWGDGPGLSQHFEGETGGSETVTLLESETPSHGHTVSAQNIAGNRTSPVGNSFTRASAGRPYIPASSAPALVNMAPQALPAAGGSLPHNNMQPYLTCYFNIALQGVYPQRQ